MQNLLFKGPDANIDSRITPNSSSIWGQLGPVLLLGSFAILVLKCAPLYWPLALTAFVGYATTLYLRKKGLSLSLIILAAVLFLLVRSGAELLWPLLLASSIALSWLLVFLGSEERSAAESGQDEKILGLQENCKTLEKLLRDAKLAISKESKDLILEKERLIVQLNESISKCNQTVQSLQESEKDREKLVEKCDVLSHDVFAAQSKEIAFQHALEDAQNQLLKLKGQLATALENPKGLPTLESNIVPMEESDIEEKIRTEHVQHQYANLREQFEEKSALLDQARKDLFKTENELLSLQKAWEEQAHELSEEGQFLIQDLKKMDEESRELELQIGVLQEFITELLSPKKRVTRSKKSSSKQDDPESLPLLLQERIDKISIENT